MRSLTDLAEKLAVLNRNARQGSECISDIDLIKRKQRKSGVRGVEEKARVNQKILRKKKTTQSDGPSESISLKYLTVSEV